MVTMEICYSSAILPGLFLCLFSDIIMDFLKNYRKMLNCIFSDSNKGGLEDKIINLLPPPVK